MKRINLLLIIAIIAASSSKLAAQQHSISAKNPLLVMDSVILGAFGINLPLFSPDDIKSITVYKNKEAIALWGKAGENGVLIITSKDPSKYKFRSLNDIALSHNIILKGETIFIINNQPIKDTSLLKIDSNNVYSVTMNTEGFDYLINNTGKLNVISIITKNYNPRPQIPLKKPGTIMIRGLKEDGARVAAD